MSTTFPFTRRAVAGLAIVAALAACADQQSPTAPDADANVAGAAAPAALRGAVYTSTNATSGNAVVAFARTASGALTPLGSFATGGTGIGGTVDPLFSQYDIILGPRHERLYVANAGSNDVTVFAVEPDGSLQREQQVSSGGVEPVSLAIGRGRLYVLNAGDATVTALPLTANGLLDPAAGVVTQLPAGAGGPAAVRVANGGTTLIVTERTVNRIDVFPIAANGSLGTPSSIASNGAGPFGFDVVPGGTFVVSEAAAGALSSYVLTGTAQATLRDGSVSTQGAAPCWVRIDRTGRFAYTTNAGSSFIAGFAIRGNGTLVPLSSDERTGVLPEGSTPLDLDISADGKFLYTLNAGTGAIGAFAIGADGSLSALAGAAGAVGAASGAQGLAAF